MVRNAEYSKKRYFFLKKTLKITNRGVYYLKLIWAPVAQLDRASASGVEGHEFESRRVYHFFLPFSPQNPGSEAFLLFAAESCKMVQIE